MLADFFNHIIIIKYNVQLVISLIKIISREIIFIKILGLLFLITEQSGNYVWFPVKTRQRHPA
ncbi:hypothetical protein F6P96_17735 [Escherichia coli]|nr:hypothetical protein F6P96_17735 [Escherichia coli]